MSRLTNKGQGAPFSLFTKSTDASLITACGQRFDLEDGREVVIVKAGAVDLVSGKLVQAPAIIANHENLTVTAFAPANVQLGTPAQVTVTLGATAATENQYAQGYLIVNNGTGTGQSLKITGNTAALGAASCVISLEDAPTVALDVTSKVSLIADLYKDVIVSPTTLTNKVIGATIYPISIGEYGYIATKGIVSLLADGAIAKGVAVSPSNAVAGAFESGVIAQGFVGTTVQAAVDTEYRAVSIDL
jgi:hypothetical protein